MAEKHRYVVGALRIPPEQRTIAHAVLTPQDDRAFLNVIGGDEDAPLDAPVTYAVDLTDEEAAVFAAATNCRYVERDGTFSIPKPQKQKPGGDEAQAAVIPPASTLAYMGVPAGADGAGVTVAILDGGVSDAVLAAIGCTRIAKRNFGPSTPTSDGITSEHGCWVAPCALTSQMKLLDAIIMDFNASSQWSHSAAAMRWAADNGAQVINFSSGGSTGSNALQDACAYLKTKNVVLVASAGNDGQNRLGYPSAYCTNFENVVSSIAFVEGTDQRASFSNHASTGSGAAPGDQVLSLNRSGGTVRVNGTSFSAPHMTGLIARGIAKGYTALQVARALIATARDTPEPDAEEGAGAWRLDLALARLAGTAPAPPPTPAPIPVQRVTFGPATYAYHDDGDGHQYQDITWGKVSAGQVNLRVYKDPTGSVRVSSSLKRPT